MKYTYWVDFSWTYKYLDKESNQWEEYEDFDARRFCCKRKDIKKNVTEYVKQELDGDTYKDLKIIINDSYWTTDGEI